MRLNIVSSLLLSTIIFILIESCSRGSEQFLGTYNLEVFNCEECEKCSIKVNSDFTYEVRQLDSLIYTDTWETKHDIQEGIDVLLLKNGPTNSIYPHTPSISYINIIDCKEYYCQDLLSSEYHGVIISIEPYTGRQKMKLLTLITENGDTITDYPKSIFHPWLQDTCHVGDILIKKKGLLDYIIIREDADTIFLDFVEPNS